MTGLVGWWPLHENSGSTARDLSGEGNHGTLSGGVTQGVAGKGGLTSYSFDGSDDIIEVSDSSELDMGSTDSFTVAGWVRFNQDLTGSEVLFGKRDPNSDY